MRNTEISVYLSHAWHFTRSRSELSAWLMCDWQHRNQNLRCTDCSLEQHDPVHAISEEEPLRQAIYAQIELASVVILPTGMYTRRSHWMRKEIEGANTLGVPVLAIPPGPRLLRGSIARQVADLAVAWDQDGVRQAVVLLHERGKS